MGLGGCLIFLKVSLVDLIFFFLLIILKFSLGFFYFEYEDISMCLKWECRIGGRVGFGVLEGRFVKV